MFKRILWWGWALGVGLFALQFGLYSAAYRLSVSLGTIDHAWCPKIAAIDDRVHLILIFVIIYVFSYVFWICAPVAVSLTRKRNLVNYVTGLLLAYIIGFCIFTFLPSYMDRTAEGLMNISANDGFFNAVLAWVYSNDGSSMAYNLCPSFHCMISTYSYLGVRKQPEISKGYRVYSFMLDMVRKDILPSVCTLTDELSSTVNNKKKAVPSASCRYESAMIEKLSGLCDVIFERTEYLEGILSKTDLTDIFGCAELLFSVY